MRLEEQDDSAPVPGITAAAGAAALGAVFAGQEDEPITSGSELESEDAKEDEYEAAEPLPDWMSSAGPEQEQLVAAELDDFEDELPALGPDDLVEEDLLGAPGEQGEAEQLPDWMSVAEPAAGSETPDWLKDAMESTDEEGDAFPRAASLAAGAAILSDDEAGEPAFEAETGQAEEDLLDRTVGDAATEGITDEDSPEEDLPEAAGFAAGEAAIAGAALAGAALGASFEEDDRMPTEAVDEADLPDADEFASLPTGDEQFGEVDDDIPDWLQDLGEDMPAAEETAAPPVVFEDLPAEDEPISEMEIETTTEDSVFGVTAETPISEDDQLLPGELGFQQV